MDANARDCKHGRLARVCDDCAHEKEIADLTAEKDKLAQHCSDVMAENAELRGKLDRFDSDSLERLSKTLEALEHRSRQYLDTIEGLRESNASCKDAIHLQNKRCEDLFKANEEQAALINKLKAELEREKARKHAAVDAFDKTRRLCNVADGNDVTDQKIRDLLARGHEVVGYVLGDPYPDAPLNNRKLAFVVGGRVEWFFLVDWVEQMRERGDQERKIIDLERHLEKQTRDFQEARGKAVEAWLEIERLKKDATFEQAAKFRDELKCANQKIAQLEKELARLKDIACNHKCPGSDDTFVPGLGTVRACLDCGCLVAGGPTRCGRCAKECDPKELDSRGCKIELHNSSKEG